MGGGNWSTTDYVTSAKTRTALGVSDFGHDDDVRRGKASGIHPDLDPKKVAGPASPLAGQPIRESRDIAGEHEESLPIAVIFDVTGSMGGIPRILQKKLATLMDVVIAKASVKDPQILVGAVGDSFSDSYPFQVGQFESDNRFDEQLRNIILEGGGGSQSRESYGLAYRFAAHHTALDSFEKRGKKGYFFTMGDENFWPTVTAEDVRNIFGIGAENDESVKDLLSKAQEKWEVFHLFAKDGSYPDNTAIHNAWRELLGERFIMVEDSSLVCEVIAGTIHALESSYDIDRVVSDMGLSGKDASVVKNALVPVANRKVPAHVAKGGLPSAHRGAGKGGVTRV